MKFSLGTKLGPYEILSLLGAGGMGEVYKAQDTRLHRFVAIKVLPERVSASAELEERFKREAQTLASLNHPHICSVFDVGKQDGADYLVVEYLEGQTLAERLVKGALPLDHAMKIAIEIMDALDKAHRQGVVHRDVKPSNIMLTKNGAMLLDFGLAKFRPGQQPSTLSGMPTKTELTAEGMIVGTLQYMAPEQLEGHEANERADIFSFGAVLYEMLSGRKAFEGKSQVSLIAAIMGAEAVPLLSLQPQIPAALDHVVRGCLAKDPNDRWQTAHDVLKQLRWIAESAPSKAIPGVDRKSPRRFSIGIASVLFLGIIVAAVATYVYRTRPASQPMRFTIAMPEKISLAIGEDSPGAAAISPDGARMVLRGVDGTTGKILLYVRPIDSVDLTPLPGTEDAASPFWSHDSRAIAFFAQGKLMRVDLAGSAPQTICDAPTASGSGTWNRDDVIVASLSDQGPLSRVSANGGMPAPVTSLNKAKERAHSWPYFLPDGKHFLYTSLGLTPSESAAYLGTLGSTDTKLLITDIYSPVVYATPGSLLFLQRGALMTQPFDSGRAEVSGKALRLAERAGAPFAASENGTIMYRNRVVVPDRFLWISWDGREIAPVMEPGYYADPALSADGSKLAYAKRESPGATLDIWVLEFANPIPRRLTSDPADDRSPVWSPDGKSIVFWSKRENEPGLFRKNSNGTGDEDLIVPYKGDIWPYQWAAGGREILYFGGTGVPFYDIFKFSFSDRKSVPLIHTAFTSADGAISPDGHWLAYENNETGRYEVHITTYPPSSTNLSVTTGSGVDSLWSDDGKKLFYVNSITLELFSMDVKLGNPPEFSAPRRIYPGPLDWTSAHSFDIDTKHQRVLVQTSTAQQTDLTVLLNWQSSLGQ